MDAGNVKTLLGGLAALTLACAAPGPANAQAKGPLACWFYKYQWAYFRMIPNVAPPTPFATGGEGTGLMVTDGRPPTTDETAAIVDSIQKGLPRGDLQAPSPQAFIRGISRIACPRTLDGLDLSVAKIVLKQPAPK